MRPTLARGQAEQRRDELARLNEDLRRTHYTKDMNLARVAWDENNLGRTRELLEKHRPRPGEPDLRGFEWYYLDRLARGGQLRIDAHAGGVNSVAFMPDGRRLISSGITEPLRRIGQPRAPLAPFACGTRRPDGRFPSSSTAPLTRWPRRHSVPTAPAWPRAVAITRSCSGTSPRAAWSRWKGRPITSPTACASAPTASAWFPSTAPARSHTHAPVPMRVWDASSRKPIMTIDVGCPTAKHPSARMVDGSSSAPPTSGSLTVYDAETGREAFSCEHPGWSAVRTRSSARTARAWPRVRDEGIRIWDVTSREPVAFWPSESMLSQPPGLQPGRQALGESRFGGIAEVWDTATGRKVQTFKGHSGDIHAIAFSPDGTRLATGGADGTVRLWDIAQSGDGAAISLPDSEMRWGIPDLSPDGRSLLAFSSSGGTRRAVGHRDTPDARQPDRAPRGVDQPAQLERRRRTPVPGGRRKGRG